MPSPWATRRCGISFNELETKNKKGKRESLYQFYDNGLAKKSTGKSKGIFVAVKTLVGQGGGTIGVTDTGRKLTEYILDAVQDQYHAENGKPISVYPVEVLADRFEPDIDLYRKPLAKFLKDPKFFDEEEQEEIEKFLDDLRTARSQTVRRDCGQKLWRVLHGVPQDDAQHAMEAEEVLKHMVETLIARGYEGLLLILDEVSLFMKNRTDDQRIEDEKTLVVLSNRLAKTHCLPVWTICSAQQALESKMGVKNIIANDRLKNVALLQDESNFYDIVLSRVRTITKPESIDAVLRGLPQGLHLARRHRQRDVQAVLPVLQTGNRRAACGQLQPDHPALVGAFHAPDPQDPAEGQVERTHHALADVRRRGELRGRPIRHDGGHRRHQFQVQRRVQSLPGRPTHHRAGDQGAAQGLRLPLREDPEDAVPVLHRQDAAERPLGRRDHELRHGVDGPRQGPEGRHQGQPRPLRSAARRTGEGSSAGQEGRQELRLHARRRRRRCQGTLPEGPQPRREQRGPATRCLEPASRSGRLGDQDLAPDDGPRPQHEVPVPWHRPRRAEGFRGRVAWPDDQGPGLHA